MGLQNKQKICPDHRTSLVSHVIPAAGMINVPTTGLSGSHVTPYKTAHQLRRWGTPGLDRLVVTSASAALTPNYTTLTFSYNQFFKKNGKCHQFIYLRLFKNNLITIDNV